MLKCNVVACYSTWDLVAVLSYGLEIDSQLTDFNKLATVFFSKGVF